MSENKIDESSFIKPDIGGNLMSNVDGIFSIKPMIKYASGARTTLKINSKIVGFAMGVSWNIETVVTEIRTIDDYLPIELAPRYVAVSGTFSGLMIPGMGPSNELIQSDVLNFLAQRYITIEVRDSQTDNLLFFTNKAMVTSRSESLNSEQLGKITLNWKAIGWKDDREPTPIIDEYKEAQAAAAKKKKDKEAADAAALAVPNEYPGG